MLAMTSPSVTISVVAGKPQLSISELYQRFVDHYGTTVPRKRPDMAQLQRQNNRLRAMPAMSRRGGRHVTRGGDVINSDEVKESHCRETGIDDTTEYRHAIHQSDVTRPPPEALKHRVNVTNADGVPDSEVKRRPRRVVGRNPSVSDLDEQKKDGPLDNYLPLRIRRYQWTSPGGVDGDGDVIPVTSMTDGKCSESDNSVDVISSRPMKYGNRAINRRIVLLRNFSRQPPRNCFLSNGVDECGNSAGNFRSLLKTDNECPVPSTTCSKPTNVKKGNSRHELPSLNLTNRSVQYSDISDLDDLKSYAADQREMAKYVDPMVNSPAAFTQRVNEIVLLELKTIRWEKTRRLRKKRSRDSL